MSISRSIVRPLQKSVTRSVIQGSVTDPLQELIQQLFGNGEQGFLITSQQNPLGSPEIYQDSEATTEALPQGDVVGYVGDLSGGGNNFTQSVAESKPLYSANQKLLMDGVDDYLDSGASRVGATGLFADSSESWFAAVCFTYTGNQIGTPLARAGSSASGRTFQIWASGDSLFLYLRGVQTATSFELTLGETYLVWVRWDGSTATTGCTGFSTEVASVGTAPEETDQRIVLGARTNGTGYHTTCSYKGAVVVDRTLSDQEIGTLSSYFL